MILVNTIFIWLLTKFPCSKLEIHTVKLAIHYNISILNIFIPLGTEESK